MSVPITVPVVSDAGPVPASPTHRSVPRLFLKGFVELSLALRLCRLSVGKILGN